MASGIGDLQMSVTVQQMAHKILMLSYGKAMSGDYLRGFSEHMCWSASVGRGRVSSLFDH